MFGVLNQQNIILKMENLERNKQDLIASVGKSVLGSVPCMGSFLAELWGEIIPNQRVDRLIKYVRVLKDKISHIPEEIIDRLKTDESFIDLIQEGFIQASRAITDERRGYIASVLANGITDDSLALEESKYLLKLLQEINDVEVIWLRYYKSLSKGGDEEFEEKHKNILYPIRISITGSVDKETKQKAALQESYKTHLERLGFIKNCISIDTETRMPEIDRFTGLPKVHSKSITELGKMLLKQIGIDSKD